jgi:hypothetical protein
MALLDPADHTAHDDPAAQRTPTRHPMICLAGGFGFIIVAALAVHVIFNAVV